MGGVVRIAKRLFSPKPDYPAIVQTMATKELPKPAAEEALAPEVEAPPTVEETILKKKKKGRYSTLLTGGKGVLGSPDIEKKSLLGS